MPHQISSEMRECIQAQSPDDGVTSEQDVLPGRHGWSLGTLSRRHLGTFVGVGTLGALLTACGTATKVPSGANEEPQSSDFSARFAGFDVADEPNGDLSKVVWPEFVTQADPEVKPLYAFQVTHGELMRGMPCFCGCGQSSGHRNNRDCYVRAVNADGSVVFDAMAPT